MSPKKVISYGPPISSRNLMDWKKVRVLPNPWPPRDIERLITIAGTTAGLASIAYKLIKLWIDDRGARRIRIKKGDAELEIEGGISAKDIERAFGQFRKMARGQEGEIKVILPRNADRSIPSETDDQKTIKKKGSKK